MELVKNSRYSLRNTRRNPFKSEKKFSKEFVEKLIRNFIRDPRGNTLIKQKSSVVGLESILPAYHGWFGIIQNSEKFFVVSP